MGGRPAPGGGTRAKLIAAAVEVVARDGLEKASVKAIAAQAGITPGLVHYHFPTKEKVLEAALVEASEAYAAELRAIRQTVPPGQLTQAFFDRGLRNVEADRDLFRVRLAFAARAISDPELAARFRVSNETGVLETATLFAADRGEAAPNAADIARARAVKACYDGIMLGLLTDPDFPFEAAAKLLQSALGLTSAD